MRTTRRDLLAGAGALMAAPSVAGAQTRPGQPRVVRAVMHGDIPTFDPIWTTANMAAYHGGMVYDTLFGTDAQSRPQPQMVSRHNVSDDS
jgi:peptide/nickel transport system substrate-binding protein